jgi:hypothetical protein
VIKEAGRSWNELRFLATVKTEMERTHRQPMFLEGTMDFIIIIIIIINPLGYLSGNSFFICQEKKSSQNSLRCKPCKLKIVICSHSIAGFQKFLP